MKRLLSEILTRSKVVRDSFLRSAGSGISGLSNSLSTCVHTRGRNEIDLCQVQPPASGKRSLTLSNGESSEPLHNVSSYSSGASLDIQISMSWLNDLVANRVANKCTQGIYSQLPHQTCSMVLRRSNADR